MGRVWRSVFGTKELTKDDMHYSQIEMTLKKPLPELMGIYQRCCNIRNRYCYTYYLCLIRHQNLQENQGILNQKLLALAHQAPKWNKKLAEA